MSPKGNRTPGGVKTTPPNTTPPNTTPPTTTTPVPQTKVPTSAPATNTPTTGKTTSQIMIEYEQEYSSYGDELKKYKAMTPEQQAAYFPTIANKYNRASLIQRTFKDTTFQIENYPNPDLRYNMTKYQADPAVPFTPKEPGKKNWSPPEVRGEKPLTQMFTAAEKILREKKIDWLADISGAWASVTNSLISTERQAWAVDIIRDFIGWSAEANATLTAPMVQTNEKGEFDLAKTLEPSTRLLRILTSPIGEVLDHWPKYGKTAIALAEIEGRVLGNKLNRGQGYATKEEMSMTGREKYETAKALGGTLEYVASAAVDVGGAAFETWRDTSLETIYSVLNHNIASGTSKTFSNEEIIASIYNKSTAKLAYSEQRKPMLEAEFLRRYRNGESADLLAIELSDPVKELVAEIMYDPLNFIEFVTAPVLEGYKALKILEANSIKALVESSGKAEDATRLAGGLDNIKKGLQSGKKGTKILNDGVDAVIDITNAYDIERNVERSFEAAKRGKVVGKLFRKEYEIAGVPGKILGKLQSTHVAEYMQSTKKLLNALLHDEKMMKLTTDVEKGQRMSELLLAYARYGAGEAADPAAYRVVMGILGESASVDFFFSPSGKRGAKIFSELMMDASGHLDDAKFDDLYKIVANSLGSDSAAEQIAQKIALRVEDIFPTIGRRLEFEKRAVDLKQAIDAGSSKRIARIQKEIITAEEEIAKQGSKMKAKYADEDMAKLAEDWIKNPKNAPKEAESIKKLTDRVERAKQIVAQANELPRNIKYWADNPVNSVERLGWEVMEGKEWLYNKFVPALNRIYIRWNPGQWGRNFITNEMHVFIDQGATAGLRTPGQVEALVNAMEANGYIPAGVIKRTNILTGESFEGTAMKLFKDLPINQQVEVLGQAQVAVASVDRSLNKAFAVMQRNINPILKRAGVPDDQVRAFWVEARRSSPSEALRKVIGGENPRGIFSYTDDLREVETLQGFGIVTDLDELCKPHNAGNDELWGRFFDHLEDRIEDAKNIPLSHSLDDLDGNEMAMSWAGQEYAQRAGNVSQERNPFTMRQINDFRANDEAWDDVYHTMEITGEAKLKPADDAVTDGWINLCKKTKKKVSDSKHEADRLADALTREKGIPESVWRPQKDAIFREKADEQFMFRMEGIDNMRNYLYKNGVSEAAVKQWESGNGVEIGIERAMDYYGDFFQNRFWTYEDWITRGGKLNYVGEGGSPVLNAFASRGIPLPTAGRSYSWNAAQVKLSRHNIDWDMPKLLGRSFTVDELAELDKAVDAIALEEKVVIKAGAGRKAAWVPLDAWQEVPVNKVEDVRNIFGVETKVEDGKTFAKWSNTTSDVQRMQSRTATIVSQSGKELYPEGYDELLKLREEEDVLAKTPFGDNPLDKMAREDAESKILKNQARRREIEAEIVSRYERKSVSVAASDIATPVGLGNGLAPQGEDVKRICNQIRERAQADQAVPIGKWATPEQDRAFSKAAQEAERYLNDIRPAIADTCRADIDFTMLNYDNRRGFDSILGFVYPYHYWYSRTYFNWMKRLAMKPQIMANYASYRRMLEKIHSDMPDYWKYSLNSNELLGMNSDSPLYFNLEATFNPLNGLTGVDFNDSDKSRGWFANTVQQIAKYGPSVYTPIILGIGLTQLALGDRDAAESWLQRLIPQTATIKAVTNLAGFDPQGKGGLELDPMVLLMGGQGKYEIRGVQRVLSQFEAKGMLPDGTPVTHEDIIDAQYAQKGPLWELASREYGRQRAPGRIMSSFGGPGFQTRPQTDIDIDQFYTELNSLYDQKGLMFPDVWSKAMSDLYQKYPYANGLLMARKSGVARDEALIYDILNRIPPGQTTEYAKAMGIDPELIDRFYSKKGLTDDNGQPTMTAIEMGRFRDSIRDLGSILAMPDTATRNEWRAAKQHYSEVFKQFSKEVMQNVDMWYLTRGKDADLGRQYLKEHPEVQQYLEARDQIISNDALLFRYYGGISFVESYYQRIMASHAEEQWPDIEKIAMAYSQVQKNGGDTKGFLKAHPQLREYWNYVDQEREKINLVLEGLTQRIPESPQASWRKDVRDLSAKATAVYESRMSMVPEQNKAIDSMALPYMPQEGEVTYANFDFTGFIKAEAEKRWPGITALDSQYDNMDKAMQQATLYQRPELAEYQKWEKEMRRRYNAAKKSQPVTTPEVPMTWDVWRPVFDPSVQRLVESYFTTGKLSESVLKNLERTLSQAGITDVYAWLDQMRDSYRGYD